MQGCGQVEMWATREFAGAEFGDMRRTKRLVEIAAGVAKDPQRAYSLACGKSGAQAISRFFAREEVDLESILRPHIDQTRNRCEGHKRILAPQDTTVLDFTDHKAKRGIGPTTASEHSRGLHQHTVMLLTQEKTPLGIAGVQIWAREDSERGCAKNRHKRLICEKESNKWLVGLAQAENATPRECELVVIGDRESDIFALFAADRGPNTHLLVRLAHNRSVESEEHRNTLEAVGDAQCVGAYQIRVPRKPGQPARDAWLELKACHVMLKPPRNRTPDIPNKAVSVWIVQATEMNAPEGVEAVEWILISTEPMRSLEQAVRAVREYASRWTIEEFHRVLKSGCKVEDMQFEDADSLIPAIGLSSVVAWRILHMTKLSREEPEMDVSAVASKQEVTVLVNWLKANREKRTEITTVRDFVRTVALLGGFLGRKSDGEPGTKVLWQGLRRLEDLLIGYKLATGQEIR